VAVYYNASFSRLVAALAEAESLKQYVSRSSSRLAAVPSNHGNGAAFTAHKNMGPGAVINSGRCRCL